MILVTFNINYNILSQDKILTCKKSLDMMMTPNTYKKELIAFANQSFQNM